MRKPPKPPPRPPLRSGPYSEIPVDFDVNEPPTPLKSVKLVRYQKLVHVVDHLSDKRADDLVEISCIFADCTDDEREVILRVVRAVPRPA